MANKLTESKQGRSKVWFNTSSSSVQWCALCPDLLFYKFHPQAAGIMAVIAPGLIYMDNDVNKKAHRLWQLSIMSKLVLSQKPSANFLSVPHWLIPEPIHMTFKHIPEPFTGKDMDLSANKAHPWNPEWDQLLLQYIGQEVKNSYKNKTRGQIGKFNKCWLCNSAH